MRGSESALERGVLGSKPVLVAAVLALVGCVEGSDDRAGGIRISGIALYQGPKVSLVSGAELVLERQAPLLAGRPARVIVTVQSVAGAEPREALVRLVLGDAGTVAETVFEQPVEIDEASEVGTEVAFELDEHDLRETSTLTAEVVEVDGFESALDPIDGVRQPDTGSWLLEVREAPRFRVHVVPVAQVGEDAPELDEERLERWRSTLHAWLPVREVELTVADEPLESDADLSSDQGWGLLLAELAAWRDDAGLDGDVFVFGEVGVTLPAAGGVAGIAATTAVESTYWRVAAGLRLPDEEQDSGLIVHELGHALGRPHAPCGLPAGTDPNYPYEGASIGVPGVDLRDGLVREPELYRDFMSYCAPQFVSDYQFGTLWTALHWVEAGGMARAPAAEPHLVIDRWPGAAP